MCVCVCVCVCVPRPLLKTDMQGSPLLKKKNVHRLGLGSSGLKQSHSAQSQPFERHDRQVRNSALNFIPVVFMPYISVKFLLISLSISLCLCVCVSERERASERERVSCVYKRERVGVSVQIRASRSNRRGPFHQYPNDASNRANRRHHGVLLVCLCV